MGVFEKCVMVLELKTLPIKQKNKLKTEIKENGGIISYVVDKKCTHVIVSHMKDVSSHRLKSIQQFQIPVVSVEYVSKCIEEGRLVDEDAYAPAEHQDVIQNTNCKNPEGEEISPLSEAFPGDDQEETVKNKDSLDKFRIYSGREGSLPHFPSVFEVAKYSIFNKVTADSEAGVVVELQCSVGNPVLPFCVSRYWGEWNNSKVMQKWKDLIFAPTSEEAVKAYELFIKDLQDKDFQQQTKLSTELNLLASEKVKKLLLEEALSSSSISQEVAVFVELIWTEALGCFDDVLASPVNSISPNDVSRAEGILLQARKAMDEGVDQNGLRGIMSEFYTILQHKHGMEFNITKKMISTKHDLCQLIRDIVNASEATLWSPTPSSLAKYQALRCSVEHVAPNTEEFSTIKELLMHRNESLTSVRIHQIFRIGRVNEMLDFQSQLGNVQPLFHASSASSFVGILSRGLLLPKVAVEQHGIDRTDIGNLGCGIYFSNALSTILKYSKPSESDGTRLLVVCDIALGECKHLHKKDFTLASAPAGYSSVLGVRQTADVASEFQDDEYVVYNPSQVQIKYVVQFCVGEDQVKSFQPTVNVTNEETPAGLSDPPAVTDADSDEEYTNPLDSVTEGLQDSSGNKIPLKSVHVKGRMVDLLAQIIVFQTYTNHSVVPIEAKYVFPLDETAAVCGFEAFINGKHVVGEVKEKEKARQEYRQAIQEGHGAYLMDQEAPDVFTISVGNLPPSSTVLIKITYVTELAIEFGSIVFRLPGSVAPWQQSKALNERTQDTVEKICVNEMEETGGFALDMSVEMPHEITRIWSGTHKIKVKKTQCKAVVITEENSSLGQGGFSLTIDLSEVYLPRMWVEKHPDKDSQACMLVFCPEFAPSSFPEDCEVVIFLDSSNSMRGAVLQEARKIALRLLNSLHCKLNVVIFGTDYKELFPCPQDDVLEAGKQFIMFSPPLMGNTDLWRPLRSLSLLAPSKGVRNIILISDGHIQSEGLTLRLVKENAHHTRIFTCGVGHTANRHMLRSLAQSGGGAYEFFDIKTKHNWREKIALQVIRMVSPGCSSVSVKWQQFNPNASQPVQAPAQLHSVFSGNQLLVYGFVPHCTQATLSGVVSNQEIQTMVSTTELQKTKGTMLHKLTARAIIRDYEYGNLHTDETEHEVRKAALKSFVIDLSKEYSIVTQYTSFVAIEKRGENETEGIDAVTTDERIAEEDVDFLPYLTWERAEDDFGEYLEEELSLCSSQNVPTSDYMWIEEEGDAFELQTSLWRDPKHHNAVVQQSFPGLEPVPQVPGGLPVPVITYQAARCLKMRSSPPPPPPAAICYSKTIPEGFTLSAVTGIEKAQNTVSAPVVFSSYSSVGGSALKMTESSYTQPFSGFGSGQQLPSNSSSEFSKGFFGFGSSSAFSNTSAVSDPANAAFSSGSDITLGENNIFSQPASSFAFSSGRIFGQSPCIDSGLVEITHSRVSAPALVRGPAWKVTESSGNSQLFSGFGPGQLPSNSSSEFSKDTFRFGSSSAFGNASAVSAPALVRGPALEVTDSSGYSQPFLGFGSGQQLPSNSSSEFSKCAFGFGSGSAFGNTSAVSAPALVRGPALEVTDSSGYSQPFSGFGSGQQLPSNSSSEFSKGALGNASAVSAPANAAFASGSGFTLGENSIFSQPASSFAFSSGRTFEQSPCIDSGLVEFDSSSDLCLGISNKAVPEECSLAKSKSKSKKLSSLTCFKHLVCNAENTSLANESLLPPQCAPVLDTAEMNQLQTKLRIVKMRRKVLAGQRSGTFPIRCLETREDLETPSRSRASSLPWTQLFDLQHQDGYWQFSPELGSLLHMDVDYFANVFLKEKGILSLGVKSSEEILRLVATMLVLQLIRYMEQLEGLIFKSLFQLDDTVHQRSEHWGSVKKAVDWVKEADWRYPSIYWRLELGRDWESTTRQLLCIDPVKQNSPLHLVRTTCFKPGCFPEGGLG